MVLTHFHEDHTGGAAEAAGWGRAQVCAHPLEAPVIRGEKPGPQPVLDDAPAFERALWAAKPELPEAPAAPVHREVSDGDVLDFGGGAEIVAAPGHTAGSIAVHLPAHEVLFTGDTVAKTEHGPVPGVFNVDRTQMLASVRRLASLRPRVACFGHGDPVTDGSSLDVALPPAVRECPEAAPGDQVEPSRLARAGSGTPGDRRADRVTED